MIRNSLICKLINVQASMKEQEINNPKIRFPVLEGDKLMKEVLNGGYNVHPVPPPNSEIKERIRKRYERERIKIEKLLTLGYTTSGDP